MPELPEIEVLRRSLEPHLVGDEITQVVVRSPKLREPLDPVSLGRLAGRQVAALGRRSKYLLVELSGGHTLVIHLGMSGRLTLTPAGTPAETALEAHEHLAFGLASGRALRLRDPRRFGLAFTLPTADLAADRHFVGLGVEPLAAEFSAAALQAAAAGRRGPVKLFLMDAQAVVGVGNIYAAESLWRAGVHPKRSVARLSAARWQRLAQEVVAVLQDAVTQGGTTLNDFANGMGESGYFQVSLAVYGRAGEPCFRCGTPIRRIVQAQRSTFYCPGCQT